MKSKKSTGVLKIGIVCYPSVGGSGIVATNLGLELAKLGHQVHFISYEQPFRLTKKTKNVFFHKVNINEYNLFKYPDYTLPLAVKIEEVQKKFILDVVHVHYAVPHATAALLARRIMRSNGTPLPQIVTTLHGTDITLLARDKNVLDVIKYSIERSHGVTAVSDSLKKDTIKFLKTDKPIEVIYNFYTPPPVTIDREKIRKSLGISNNDFVAIHLSNLRPVKRIPDLLKITSKISTRDGSASGGKSPNFKLLILAGGDFSTFEPLVKNLKLEKKIIVKSNVQDIGNYINAADLGIYPSETESFGMAMLETMSYGKPVLATRAGGVPEVVDNGKTGFLFKVGDVAGFVEKTDMLISNPKIREEMGALAKKISCERFCVHKVVPEYVEYYKKIISQKK
jgi:N-acetyl-alpha-D-glucosaminyl L-malate synthase BshA